MRFAFLGRVSTEDQQDPASSRAWQLSRATALIDPCDGDIVAEYFDIGETRALPWQRRPRANALLKALRDPHRGFDAVVIGEYALANRVQHPRNVIMREDLLIKPLDNWIAGLFRPEYRDATIAAMAAPAVPAQRSPEHDQTRLLIAECQRKLHQDRRALDEGADPVVVIGWITQTETERKRLERERGAQRQGQGQTRLLDGRRGHGARRLDRRRGGGPRKG